jgi:hypothetical protein
MLHNNIKITLLNYISKYLNVNNLYIEFHNLYLLIRYQPKMIAYNHYKYN